MENLGKYSVSVRVTAMVIREDSWLLVKQPVSPDRSWSLPGGRLEKGELIDGALV